jgi:hypothetical protein
MKTQKIDDRMEEIEALKRVLVGVKDPKHEVFIMLNAVPGENLSELVENLKVLTGLKGMPRK